MTDYMFNIVKTPVRMVMRMVLLMIMFMAVSVFGFFLSVNSNGNMRSGNTAFNGRFRFDRYTWNTDTVEPLYKISGIVMQFKQCRHEHVSRRAHAAFKVQFFHGCYLWWLIMLAR
jgi:hypothetical protein